MQIVVIDNDKALLRSLAIVLEKEGRHITCFDCPRAADRAIGETLQPDLLIIDYVMPEYDGIELLSRVRPRLSRHCSVIMISGHAEMLTHQQIGELDLSWFLSKPIDLSELHSLVEHEEKARRITDGSH